MSGRFATSISLLSLLRTSAGKKVGRYPRQSLAGNGALVTWVYPPFAIAPWRKWVMFRPEIGHRIETVTTPRMATAESRNREPAALPGAVRLNGFARIVGAGRQIPAIRAHER